MPDKQKVTLYIQPGLHRQLKIRAAIDEASMSGMVEKAIDFYLKHPAIVEETEATYGSTHQVHICPECDAALVLREGDMLSLKDQPSVIADDFSLDVAVGVSQAVKAVSRPEHTKSSEEEEFAVCK